MTDQVCPLKNWECDKKASRNSCPERVTIAERQDTSEDENSEEKPTQSKTNYSNSLGIAPTDIFNDFHLSFVQNPHYYYQQLPNDQPLLLRAPKCWITKDYDTINEILNDKRFRRNFWKNKIDQHGMQIKSDPCLATMSHWMLLNNPPDHTRVRNLVAPFFSRTQVEKLRIQIKITADQLLNDLNNRNSFDLINEFSLPLTMEFIYQILGIDPEERRTILSKTFPPRRLLDPPAPLTREELDLENFNMQNLREHVIKIAEIRRVHPKDDLISHLLQANNPGNLLTEEECISQIILLLFSGMDTVPHLIGNSVLTLHQNSEQLALLKSNPTIFSTALHELLRYSPPVHMTNMEAAEDIEIGNRSVEQGAKVILLLAAGNRDPKIFANPNALDLSRPKKHLLSFSSGIHNCLGMHLGLALFEIGIQTLLQKLPEIQIANINELDWNLSYTFKGLKKLMVNR